MMIGGGGSACSRADHGIGVTEANSANFDFSTERDFGNDGGSGTSAYSLNLWVRWFTVNTLSVQGVKQISSKSLRAFHHVFMEKARYKLLIIIIIIFIIIVR